MKTAERDKLHPVVLGEGGKSDLPSRGMYGEW
jgi:hypothetical protein